MKRGNWAAMALAVVGGFAAMLGGCGTCSFHPLWSDGKGTTDSNVVGAWVPKDPDEGTTERYVVRGGEHGEYLVSMTRDKKGVKRAANYVMRLVKLGGETFAEFRAANEDGKEVTERFGATFVSTYSLWRIKIEKDAVTLHMLDEDYIHEQTKKAPGSIEYIERDDGVMMLTSGTEKLQAFFEKAGPSAEAFKGDGGKLVREKPAPKPAK